MRKNTFLLLLSFFLLFLLGCSKKDLSEPVAQEIGNRMTIPDSLETHNQRPETVDIYLGNYVGGRCDLSVPTYAYLEIIDISAEGDGKIVMVDEAGNETTEGILLPPLAHIPYWESLNRPSVSWELHTEYSTHFTLKFPRQGDYCSYLYRLKLHQPSVNKMFITKVYRLSLGYYNASRWEFSISAEE